MGMMEALGERAWGLGMGGSHGDRLSPLHDALGGGEVFGTSCTPDSSTAWSGDLRVAVGTTRIGSRQDAQEAWRWVGRGDRAAPCPAAISISAAPCLGEKLPPGTPEDAQTRSLSRRHGVHHGLR